MIREATQLVAAFLADATVGLNAMAETLPRDVVGGVGSEDAPASVNIYNDADDQAVAASLTPPEFPSVIVFAMTREVADSGDDRPLAPHPIIVAVAYVTNDTADPLSAQQQCSSILRAGRRSMRRFRVQSLSENYRELRGVRVLNVTKVLERRVTMVAEQVKMWGWLEVHLTVADGVA